MLRSLLTRYLGVGKVGQAARVAKEGQEAGSKVGQVTMEQEVHLERREEQGESEKVAEEIIQEESLNVKHIKIEAEVKIKEEVEDVEETEGGKVEEMPAIYLEMLDVKEEDMEDMEDLEDLEDMENMEDIEDREDLY